MLIVYGFLPTAQPPPTFGRLYAVYGGFFIVLSFLWGWVVDKERPDRGLFSSFTALSSARKLLEKQLVCAPGRSVKVQRTANQISELYGVVFATSRVWSGTQSQTYHCDTYAGDCMGAIIALAGVALAWFWPRTI